jgi:hypothetical protein
VRFVRLSQLSCEDLIEAHMSQPRPQALPQGQGERAHDSSSGLTASP